MPLLRFLATVQASVVHGHDALGHNLTFLGVNISQGNFEIRLSTCVGIWVGH
jgi:hypothetical protein